MKVSLTQKEIQRAVIAYVTGQGINLQGKNVTVEFTATRSRETGIIADLTINEPETSDDLSIPAATLVGMDDVAEPTNLFAGESKPTLKPELVGKPVEDAPLSTTAAVEQDVLTTTAAEVSAPAEVQEEEAKEEASDAPAPVAAASLFG